MSEPLTEDELAVLTPGQRETIARVEAMAAQDAIDAANEVTLVLTREQADAVVRVLESEIDTERYLRTGYGGEHRLTDEDLARLIEARDLITTAMQAKGMQ